MWIRDKRGTAGHQAARPRTPGALGLRRCKTGRDAQCDWRAPLLWRSFGPQYSRTVNGWPRCATPQGRRAGVPPSDGPCVAYAGTPRRGRPARRPRDPASHQLACTRGCPPECTVLWPPRRLTAGVSEDPAAGPGAQAWRHTTRAHPHAGRRAGAAGSCHLQRCARPRSETSAFENNGSRRRGQWRRHDLGRASRGKRPRKSHLNFA